MATALAKRMYDCFSRGDLPGVLSLLADDIEWELVGPDIIPYFGLYRGLAEVKRFFALLFEHEEILEFVPEQFIGGDSSVAVLGHERGRSRATGKEFSTRWCHVFETREGKIIRWREYINTVPLAAAYQR